MKMKNENIFKTKVKGKPGNETQNASYDKNDYAFDENISKEFKDSNE